MELNLENIGKLIDLARSKHVMALKLDGLEFQLGSVPVIDDQQGIKKKNTFGLAAGNPTTEQFLFAASEGMSDDDVMSDAPKE